MPDPNMTALPSSGSTSWYSHYSEIDEKVRTQMSPGFVHLDDFAGATDDDKLTACLAYVSAQSRIPAIQLPGRNVTFALTRTPFSGLRIYGASGRGPKNLEQGSEAYVPCKVILNTGFGTSSWWYGTGTYFDIYMENLALHAGNSNVQFWHQPSGTLYSCEFHSFDLYGLRHCFGAADASGNPTGKALFTQVLTTGHWTNSGGGQNVQHIIGGSDNSLWVTGYLNIQGNGSVAGAGRYLIIFDNLQKTKVGELYMTAVTGWRALRFIGGSGGYGTSISGARFEGASTGNPNVGVAVKVEGGGLSLTDCWFAYSMTSPSAGENGVIHQTGGNLSVDRPTYNRGNTALTVPLLYSAGGKAFIRAAASNTEETMAVAGAGGVVTVDYSVAASGTGIIRTNVLANAGAPVVNVTHLGVAGVGSLLADSTNGKLYICTATNGTSTITWTVVGTQT